jgi:hypothetical protein
MAVEPTEEPIEEEKTVVLPSGEKKHQMTLRSHTRALKETSKTEQQHGADDNVKDTVDTPEGLAGEQSSNKLQVIETFMSTCQQGSLSITKKKGNKLSFRSVHA